MAAPFIPEKIVATQDPNHHQHHSRSPFTDGQDMNLRGGDFEHFYASSRFTMHDGNIFARENFVDNEDGRDRDDSDDNDAYAKKHFSHMVRDVNNPLEGLIDDNDCVERNRNSLALGSDQFIATESGVFDEMDGRVARNGGVRFDNTSRGVGTSTHHSIDISGNIGDNSSDTRKEGVFTRWKGTLFGPKRTASSSSSASQTSPPPPPTISTSKIEQWTDPCSIILFFSLVVIPMIITLIFVIIQCVISSMFTYHLAVIPRTAKGLAGVFLSCWGHWSWKHWFGNMFGWIMTAPIIIINFSIGAFGFGFLFVQILSAFFVWIAGSTGAHAGLSGVICGLFVFLMASVLLERPLRLSTVIFVFVAAAIYLAVFVASTFTFSQNVSWESHLFGSFFGGLFAYFYFQFPSFHSFVQHPYETVKSIECPCCIKRRQNSRVTQLTVTMEKDSPTSANTASGAGGILGDGSHFSSGVIGHLGPGDMNNRGADSGAVPASMTESVGNFADGDFACPYTSGYAFSDNFNEFPEDGTRSTVDASNSHNGIRNGGSVSSDGILGHGKVVKGYDGSSDEKFDWRGALGGVTVVGRPIEMRGREKDAFEQNPFHSADSGLERYLDGIDENEDPYSLDDNLGAVGHGDGFHGGKNG